MTNLQTLIRKHVDFKLKCYKFNLVFVLGSLHYAVQTSSPLNALNLLILNVHKVNCISLKSHFCHSGSIIIQRLVYTYVHDFYWLCVCIRPEKAAHVQ